MAERLTIIDFVEKYVAMYSKNPFLWEKNLDTNVWEPTTYEETLAKAKRIAAGLMALGVQKGEKISYLSEGRDMWVIGELGVLYAGAVNVPLSIKLGETNDLVFRVKHSDSKYVITSKFQLAKVRAILPECPMVEKVIIFDEIADKQENEIFISEIIEIEDGTVPLGDQPDFGINDDPVIFDDPDVPLGTMTGSDSSNPYTGVASPVSAALAAAGASAILLFATGKRRKK